MEMAHRHTSQVYEWLPYNKGDPDEVPATDAERKKWLFQGRMPRYRAIADRFRQALVERYGEERGKAVVYAEAFELCEYGGALTDEKRLMLFGGI